MPQKPMRPCRFPGCPHLTDDKSGYCPEHLKQTRRRQDKERGTSTQRGYNYRWQRYRRAYLAAHPLCVLCLKKKPEVVREATVVDHIIPHRGDHRLFWDPANHQSLCKECHDIKTAKEDGAFGKGGGG